MEQRRNTRIQPSMELGFYFLSPLKIETGSTMGKTKYVSRCPIAIPKLEGTIQKFRLKSESGIYFKTIILKRKK
jgi:hypothetical protein